MLGECPFHGKCQNIAEECKRLSDDGRNITAELGDVRERVAIAEQSTKSAHHRLDSMEEQTKAVIRLAVSVENMSSKMEDMIAIHKDHDGRISDLEKQPGDVALKRNHWIAITLGSGAIGMLFTVLSAIAMGLLKIKG